MSYEVIGFKKTVEIVMHDTGRDVLSHIFQDLAHKWADSDLSELIDRLMKFCKATDDDCMSLGDDGFEDSNLVSIQVMEAADNGRPTPAQLAAWEAGKIAMWFCTYEFRINTVTTEATDIVTQLEKDMQQLPENQRERIRQLLLT